ncbi:MAG: formylmethanofuran dehydrogenase subunit C, partial [Pirellulales bacterium]
MTLTLTYHGQTSVPVEVEGITPDTVRDKALAEIERLEIFHGNRRLPLAEFFSIDGDPSDGEWDIEGDLSGVHWIGAHMHEGAIRVRGAAGRHVGSQMTGGTIDVEGDAGDWVGAEMRGGEIRVRGRAGHLIGAAYRGSLRGMTGGTIVVDG